MKLNDITPYENVHNCFSWSYSTEPNDMSMCLYHHLFAKHRKAILSVILPDGQRLFLIRLLTDLLPQITTLKLSQMDRFLQTRGQPDFPEMKTTADQPRDSSDLYLRFSSSNSLTNFHEKSKIVILSCGSESFSYNRRRQLNFVTFARSKLKNKILWNWKLWQGSPAAM